MEHGWIGSCVGVSGCPTTCLCGGSTRLYLSEWGRGVGGEGDGGGVVGVGRVLCSGLLNSGDLVLFNLAHWATMWHVSLQVVSRTKCYFNFYFKII